LQGPGGLGEPLLKSQTLPLLVTEDIIQEQKQTILFTTQAAAAATYLTIATANSRQLLTENLKTGNHTLEAADANRVVAMNNSAPATVTIPNSSTFDFPIGTIINVYAITTQDVTIAGALGVQVRNAGKIYKQFVEISLRKRGLNEWVVAGSMRPA
jgi:hypothetical protein